MPMRSSAVVYRLFGFVAEGSLLLGIEGRQQSELPLVLLLLLLVLLVVHKVLTGG